MLDQLCKKIIWKLKRQSPLAGDEVKNRWEDFCWHYHGDSNTMGMWEDYIIAEISEKFEKLKEMDRFEAWLETNNGENALQSFMGKEFDRYIPLEYLDLKKISQEIAYHEQDVCDEVYSLIKSSASDYYFESDR